MFFCNVVLEIISLYTFCFFTECQVDEVSGDYVYHFKHQRLKSSDVFRLDFSVKGTNDADLSLSEFTNETSYYDIGKTISIIIAQNGKVTAVSLLVFAAAASR